MIDTRSKAVLAMAGLTLYGLLIVTAAFAGAPPQKTTKKPPAKAAPSAATIAAGKKVYEANACGGCHAVGGTGGTSGPELTKVAADPKHTAKWLEAQVKNPKTHTPESTMPPYGDKIKGKDLSNLVAYLGSLKK